MRIHTPLTASVLLGTLIVVATSALPACSDDDPSPAGELGSGSAPGGFCGELARLPERCADAASSGPDACTAKLVATCTDFTSLLGTALVDAAGSCLASAPCGSSPFACIGSSLAGVQPSAAQKALAEAYCTSCSPVPGDACTKAFVDPASDLGKVLLPLGDDVATAVEDACASGVTCKATFSTCAEAVVLKKLGEKLDADAAKCLVTGLASAAGGATPGGGGTDGGTKSPVDGGTTEPSEPPPPGVETWDLRLVRLEVPATDTAQAAWDAFGGNPDLRVEIEGAPKGATKNVWSSGIDGPDDAPVMASGTLLASTVPSTFFTSSAGWLRIRVVDRDVSIDDLVGQCVVGGGQTASPQDGTWTFAGSLGQHKVTCAAPKPLASGTGTGFTLTYELVKH